MNGRKFKFGAVFLLAGALFVGVGHTPIPSSFCNFVESYQAVKNTNAPMHIWDRLVYSFALSRQRASECKLTHGAA